MSKHFKTLRRILAGQSDQTLRYEELCTLLGRLGFDSRQHGSSHRIFYRDDVRELVNLQPRRDGTAKPYQVRQVRSIIIRYRLAGAFLHEWSDDV